MANFNLGQVVMTAGVNNLLAEDIDFAKEVASSLKKYVQGDWGDLCQDDKTLNEEALVHGERIFAKYDIKPSIYIITERDRSVTTILFPSEY